MSSVEIFVIKGKLCVAVSKDLFSFYTYLRLYYIQTAQKSKKKIKTSENTFDKKKLS